MHERGQHVVVRADGQLVMEQLVSLGDIAHEAALHRAIEFVEGRAQLFEVFLGSPLCSPGRAFHLKDLPHGEHRAHLLQVSSQPRLPALVEREASRTCDECSFARLDVQDATAGEAADGLSYDGPAYPQTVDKLPLAWQPSAYFQLPVGDQFLD